MDVAGVSWPAMRKHGEVHRAVVLPVDSGCKRRGKGGGRSQGLATVPDQAKGAAEEALTAQTSVTRNGGARLDPERREGEGSWGSAGDR